MPHQDHALSNGIYKSSHLLEVTQWLLSEVKFHRKLHASCSWTFRTLVMTALFWSWSSERTLAERFSCAQRLTKHLDRMKTRTTSSQAFLEILRRHTDYLKAQLLDAFRCTCNPLIRTGRRLDLFCWGLMAQTSPFLALKAINPRLRPMARASIRNASE